MDWFASYKEIAKWVGRGAEYISLQSFGTKSSLEPFDSKELLAFPAKNGGDKRDRTADLLNAIQALSQLSYTPKYTASNIHLVQRK